MHSINPINEPSKVIIFLSTSSSAPCQHTLLYLGKQASTTSIIPANVKVIKAGDNTLVPLPPAPSGE
jgi:hypothetical protein